MYLKEVKISTSGRDAVLTLIAIVALSFAAIKDIMIFNRALTAQEVAQI